MPTLRLHQFQTDIRRVAAGLGHGLEYEHKLLIARNRRIRRSDKLYMYIVWIFIWIKLNTQDTMHEIIHIRI